MAVATANGSTVPVGSDPYALTADLKRAIEGVRGLIPINGADQQAALPGLFPGGKLPVPTLICRLDLPRSPILKWDGVSWVWASGLRHAEFTGNTGVTPATLWGPGLLSRDSTKDVNGGVVTSPNRDELSLTEAGEYSIFIRARLDKNTTGTTWMSLRRKVNAEEIASADIVNGFSSATLSLPNYYIEAPEVLELKFYTATSGTTLTTRFRIDKLPG